MEKFKLSYKDIADSCGVNVRTLKTWERDGLFETNRNDENNYRDPNCIDIGSIFTTAFLKRIKMTSRTIKKLAKSTISDQIAIYSSKAQELTEYIAELKHSVKVLENQSQMLQTAKDYIDKPFAEVDPPFNKIILADFFDKRSLSILAHFPNNAVSYHHYVFLSNAELPKYEQYKKMPKTIYDDLSANQFYHLIGNHLNHAGACLITNPDDNSIVPFWQKNNSAKYFLCVEKVKVYEQSGFGKYPFNPDKNVDWLKEALKRNYKVNYTLTQFVTDAVEEIDGKQHECTYFNHYLECEPIDDAEKKYIMKNLYNE